MRLTTVGVGVFLLMAAAVGRGASFGVVPEVTAAFNLDGTPALVPDIHSRVGHPLIYRVDFDFTIGQLSAQEGGFADLEMDVDLTGGLTDQGGWQRDESVMQQPGGRVGPVWDYNGDDGPDRTDLRAIVAVLGEPRILEDGSVDPADPRVRLGQDGAGHLGSIDVLWDGVSSQTLSLANVEYATFNSAFDWYGSGFVAEDNGVIQFGGVATGLVVGRGLVVPEAGSLGVVGCAVVVWLGRRRMTG